VGELASDIDNLTSIVSNGGTVEDVEFDKLKGRILRESDPVVRDKMMKEVVTVDTHSKVMDTMKLNSPAEFSKMLDENIDRIFKDSKFADQLTKRATREEIKQIVKKSAAKEYSKALGPKSSEYFVDRDPKLRLLLNSALEGNNESYKEYRTLLKSHQEFFDVPGVNRKVHQSIKDTFGYGLKESIDDRNPVKTIQLLDRLEKMVGGDTTPILRNLGISEKYSVIGEIGKNPRTMADVERSRKYRELAISNLSNSDIIQESYKKSPNSDMKNIAERVADDNIYKAMVRQGGGTGALTASAAADAVILDVKRRVGEGDPEATAIKDAWKMFGDSLNVIQGENKSPIVMSKIYDGQKVSPYLDSLLPNTNYGFDDDYSVTEQFDITLDRGFTKQNYDDANYEWVGSQDEDTVQLRMEGKGFVYTTEKDAKGKPIRDFRGDPIPKIVTVSFDEAQKKEPLERFGTVRAIGEKTLKGVEAVGKAEKEYWEWLLEPVREVGEKAGRGVREIGEERAAIARRNSRAIIRNVWKGALD